MNKNISKLKCTYCASLRLYDDFEDSECGVYYCNRTLQKIIDEYDFDIFKNNGHNYILAPNSCPRL